MSEGVDTTVLAAFAVGFVSFISPCVLPLVPGYLSAVSGVSLTEIREGDRRLKRILLPALAFCVSFTLVFVALGMTATSLGSVLKDERGTLDKVAGVVIIALGVFFLLTPFVDRLNREWRPEALISRAGSGGPLVAGAAFAFAWTPCVGPTLGSILTAASVSDTVAQGGVLLLFYSLGLAVPFLLTAVAFTRATSAFRWLRDRYLIVTAVSGAVLIAMGVLLYTGELTQLNIEAQQALDSVGLNVFGELSETGRGAPRGPSPFAGRQLHPDLLFRLHVPGDTRARAVRCGRGPHPDAGGLPAPRSEGEPSPPCHRSNGRKKVGRAAAARNRYIESGALTPSRSSARAIVRLEATLNPIRKDSSSSGSAPTTRQSR